MFAAFASGFARYALPSEHFPNDPAALPFIDRATQHFYVAGKGELAHPKAGTILFMLPHKNPIFAAEKLARTGGAPIFGVALKKKMREYFLETRTIEWEAFSEFLPHAGCAVSLDPTTKDPFGLPSARISIAVHPTSATASDWLAKKTEWIMDATGAKELGRFDDRTYAVLQAGTTRMGKDPKTSVCDPTCRTHDIKNLYIADSSSFPSGSGAPWTLTIMANAVRVARAMIAASKTGAL
jgi:choline dehydrogenase-like flavoprotein